jgi:hypothetical protein
MFDFDVRARAQSGGGRRGQERGKFERAGVKLTKGLEMYIVGVDCVLFRRCEFKKRTVG